MRKVLSGVLIAFLFLSSPVPVRTGGLPVFDAVNWGLQHMKWLWEKVVEAKKQLKLAEMTATMKSILEQVEKVQEILDCTNKMYETMKWSLEKLKEEAWRIREDFMSEKLDMSSLLNSTIRQVAGEDPASYQELIEALKELKSAESLTETFEKVYWSTKQLKVALDEVYRGVEKKKDYHLMNRQIKRLSLHEYKKVKADATLARVARTLKKIQEEGLKKYEDLIQKADTPMQQQQLSNMGLANIQKLLVYQTQVQSRMLEVMSELLSIEGNRIAEQLEKQIKERKAVGADLPEEQRREMFERVSVEAASIIVNTPNYKIKE